MEILDQVGLGAAVGAVIGAVALLKPLIPILRKWSHLADDLIGEEPRPGLPGGRPGLMSRIDTLEVHATENREAAATAVSAAEETSRQAAAAASGVEEIKAQLRVNGGSSLRDRVNAIELALGSLTEKLRPCIADGKPICSKE